jgi:hypothetical protein
MTRWMTGCLVVVLCGSLFGVGQELPHVVQPDEAGYSASQRAALDEAVRELERVLGNPDLASQRSMGQNEWGVLDFAAFTAGSLERLGYQTVIVRRDDGTSGERVWVLVGLQLYATTVWLPVEPLPDPLGRQSTLGVIPEAASASLRFDPQYIAYDFVVELPPNKPPVAVIRPAARILERVATALFGHTSIDYDGDIVYYRWTFPDTDPETTISSSIWHTFPAVGTYTIELTVTDSRGAQASTTLVVQVVQENHFGCGG